MRLSREQIISLFHSIQKTVVSGKDALTKLDADIGDGDLGLTMASGFTAVQEFLTGAEAPVDMSAMLGEAGLLMAEKVPSTMGTLVSTGIIRAGEAARGLDGTDSKAVLGVFRAAGEGIAARGKAARGEKTLLDALWPALEAWESALAAGAEMPECAAAAYLASVEGAKAAEMMKSVHGKAAVFREGSIGKPDPGASAIVLILRGMHEWFDTRLNERTTGGSTR